MDVRSSAPDEVVLAIERLATRLGRGLVVVGIASPAGAAAVERLLRERLPGRELEAERVARVGEAAVALRTLNRNRDVLLGRGSIVILSASDERALRSMLAATPDLTSTPDVTFELIERLPPVDRPRLLEDLRSLARERAAFVDLTGLLPGDVATSRLPVERLYMDLVDVPTGVSPTRVLVLGQPGSGKTTFLRMLAHEYGTNERDRLGVGLRAPLFVPLPAFAHALDARRATLPLGAFLADWLADQGVDQAAGVASLGADLLVLCDGLDEVRGATARRQVLAEVRRFAAGGAAVVVSARSLVLDDLTAELLDGFTTVSVLPPSNAAREAFLRRFFQERGLREPEREARDVHVRITTDGELVELADTPLLLVFLALLHELEGRIPDRRFLLYGKIADILLDRWERARARARGAGAPSRATALGDTRRVIGALAWWMLDTGRSEVGGGELEVELARIERERGATEAEAAARARGLAEVLQTGSAVLATTGEGRWRFVHATLAEFFAGVDVARGGSRWRQVLGGVFRADWQEVVAFAAGELGVRADDARLEELATALLLRHRLGGRYGAADASTLGAVLREDPGFAPSTARQLVARFVELCFVPRYWPRSQEAVADAFWATAAVSPHRTWGREFREAVLAQAGTRWREDMQALARSVARAAPVLGQDAGALLDGMCASESARVREWGWHGRYLLAPDGEREGVVAMALGVGRVRYRFDVTQRWTDLPRLRPRGDDGSSG